MRDFYDADVNIGRNCIFANNKEHSFIRENMLIFTAKNYDDLVASDVDSFRDDCSFFKWASQFRNSMFLIVNNNDYNLLFCKWVKFLFPHITKEAAFDLYRISIYNFYCKTLNKGLPKKCYTELKQEAFEEIFATVQMSGNKLSLLQAIKGDLSLHFYIIQMLISKTENNQTFYDNKFREVFFNFLVGAYKDVLNKKLQLINFFENDCKVDALTKTKIFKQAKIPTFDEATEKDLETMRASIVSQPVKREGELIILDLIDYYFKKDEGEFSQKFVDCCFRAISQDPEHASIFWEWRNQEETDITLLSYIYNLWKTDTPALEQFKLAG